MTDQTEVLDGLAMIEAAHRRQSDLCDRLEEIADDLPRPCPFDCRMAAMLLALDPPHRADEDLWLFPSLRQRCQQEQWIAAVLSRREAPPAPGRLVTEVGALLDNLGEADGAEPPEGPARDAIQRLIGIQRRHLDWEESMILRLARSRLDAHDRVELAEVLLRHRGAPPERGRLPERRCAGCTSARVRRAAIARPAALEALQPQR